MAAKVFSIANQKGGVGKTTVSTQTGYKLYQDLKAKGLRICLIDNDPSFDLATALFGDNIPKEISDGEEGLANTVRMYRGKSIAPYEFLPGMYVMGASEHLSTITGDDLEPTFNFCEAIEKISEFVDVIIIDCPPSFGTLFITAMYASESGGVVIPAIPDDLSFKAVRKVFKRIAKLNKHLRCEAKVIGIIPNQVVKGNARPGTQVYYLEEFKKLFGSYLFENWLYRTTRISDAMSFQEELGEDSNQKQAKAEIDAVATEMVRRADTAQLISNELLTAIEEYE